MKLKHGEDNKNIYQLIQDVQKATWKTNITGNITGNKTILKVIEHVKQNKIRHDVLFEEDFMKKSYPYQCQFCGKPLTRYQTHIKHVNIEHESTNHVFCSYNCKIQWVFLLQKIQKSEETPNEILKPEVI